MTKSRKFLDVFSTPGSVTATFLSQSYSCLLCRLSGVWGSVFGALVLGSGSGNSSPYLGFWSRNSLTFVPHFRSCSHLESVSAFGFRLRAFILIVPSSSRFSLSVGVTRSGIWWRSGISVSLRGCMVLGFVIHRCI